jgi:hypothetical protein
MGRNWSSTYFFGIAARGENNGAANSRGANFSHSHHAGKRAESCADAYFQYVQWRRNVSEVSIDEEGRVAQIQVEGRLRLKPEELQQRVNQGFALALLLVAAGLGMCFRAWQVNQLSK